MFGGKLPKVFKESEACPVRNIIADLADKWSILVILTLVEGPQRFTVVRKRVEGISQRMLTTTLRKLERDGYVKREIFAEVPPRVEYSLTPLGQSVLTPIKELVEWADTNTDAIKKARKSYDDIK